MMDNSIEKFKNDLLFKEIHLNERSDKLLELIQEAGYYMQTIKNYPEDRDIWTRVLKKRSYHLYF